MSELKMPDINNVLIAGNITNNPIYRKTSNGTSVINFYISSNRRYRDNSGIWRENVCHVGVVAWYHLADICSEYLKRGNSVLIDGELQSRNWHNEDGTTRNVVEIRARRIQFLDRKTNADVEELVLSTEEKKEESDLSADKREKQDTQAQTMDEDQYYQKIEPTDFDFGYHDLEL